MTGPAGVPGAIDELLADVERFRMAGLATGLTALVGALGLDAGAPPEVRSLVAEQADQVAQRVDRIRHLTPTVRATLAAAGVPAVVVKGAAVVEGMWPMPSARPMSDVDVIVPSDHRAQAAAALVRAGLRPFGSSTTEDTFLAWGDGSAGRLDGESVEHNGRVEVHPGWREGLHGYAVEGLDLLAIAMPDGDLPGTLQLPIAALTAHVIGHLSSTVVRAEVRAVNVLDVVWCARAPGFDWDDVARHLVACDPRLTGPGLWALARAGGGGGVDGRGVDGRGVALNVPVELVECEVARLPAAARRRLAAADLGDVLRDPSSRTTGAWRQAFACELAERRAVVAQMGGSVRARIRRGRPQPLDPLPLRVVMVMPPVTGDDAAGALARWPTLVRTVRAVHADGRATVTVVGRTSRTQPMHHEAEGAEWWWEPDDAALVDRVLASRPDVVHVHGTGFVRLLARLGRSLPRHVALCVQHHGEPAPLGRRLALRRAAHRMVARRVDVAMFTGAGHGQAAPFRRAGVVARRTAVADVVEAGSLLPDDVGGTAVTLPGSPAILWVGRLVPGKDPLAAVDVLAALDELTAAGTEGRGSPHLHLLATDRTLERDLRSRIAADPHLVDRVHLHDPVAPGAMASWYRAADVLLSTSRGEGSGYAVIEALTLGLPVVMTDLPSHRRLVEGAPSADLFRRGDAAAAAVAIRRLVAARPGGSAASVVAWPAVVDQLVGAWSIGVTRCLRGVRLR
ncbi:MAG: glycosyltransferase [Actinobacteria bacterium]|uniref:Unannotated protein n=1 Tax=freshwater metagenome TaxID=449393 RepID=A0A6J6ESB0_9ZZZZ|nr:glycosyltransferase [Actinomycetota bacterium]